MASLYDITKGEDVELYRILSQAGYDAELARATIRRPELADLMVGTLREQLAATTPTGQFDRYTKYLLSVDKQLELLYGYDHSLWGGRLGREGWLDIDTSSDHVQSVDDLEILYVDFGSPQKNFENWYKVFVAKHANVWRWDGLKTDKKHLRLGPSTRQYEPGIHRLRINLVAHWEPKQGRSVLQVREQAAAGGETLAHAEALAAYGLHDELLKQQNGVNLPYTDLAGYELNVSGDRPWASVPCVGWRRSGRKVRLDAGWADGVSNDWAAPVVREL